MSCRTHNSEEGGYSNQAFFNSANIIHILTWHPVLVKIRWPHNPDLDPLLPGDCSQPLQEPFILVVP